MSKGANGCSIGKAAKAQARKGAHTAEQNDHGPVCSKCGHGSWPRGFVANLGLCVTCASPRTPEYFAQMAADTQARIDRYAAESAAREAERAELAELEAQLAAAA